ncbi:ribonuclease H-like domain-containing protein [Tanacetum coccineum]|uniref:Ribonuclease H-like domain-containing protein n=1 Tax=Tanacetum coccineum TaxID=301880 RepID=A0ABQ5E8C7_9ASTR
MGTQRSESPPPNGKDVYTGFFLSHTGRTVADEKDKESKNTACLNGVPKDHLRRFHGMDDAKEIWAAIKTRFGGNANSKKMPKAVLKQQFKAFTISSKESLVKGYDRFQKLLSQLDALGLHHLSFPLSSIMWLFYHKPKPLHINRTNPSHSSGSYSTYTTFPSKATPTATPGLADEVIHSFLATNADDVDLIHEDLDQIDDLDLEEMDINWQIAMTAIKIKKFYKKTGRRPRVDGKMHVAFDKRKVECFNCHNTGHFARECKFKGSKEGSKEVIDIDVQTEEAEELMVVSSTSRKAAVSENIATKKTHSPKQSSSTPISKSADDIMTFRKELDALALKQHWTSTYDVDVTINPTLRIHNAHPQSQILGDPNTPVQTRSSLKKITEAHALMKAVEAMQEELLQFKLQQVWVLVDLPNGAKVTQDFPHPQGCQVGSSRYRQEALTKLGIRYGLSMAQYNIRDKHNQVGFLRKPNESAGFAEIVDFLRGSNSAVSLTKKIFGNMKRGFQGAPRPLLPSMLLVAINPNAGQEHAAQAPSHPSSSSPTAPPPPPIPTHTPPSPPIPTSPPPPIPSPTPPPIPTPPPPPETEPTTDEYIYEEQSPVHPHFSPSQEQAPSHMPLDDLLQAVPKLISRIDSLEMDLKQTKLTMGNAIVKLVKKVKKLEGFLKRRNLVLTDSEDEEPKAQGRKSQDDPQDSSIQGLVTPPTTKAYASGEEQVEDISPNTLMHPETSLKSCFLKVKQDRTAGEDKGQREGKAPMLSEETPKKSKEQILQEEASLARSIRNGSLQKEKEDGTDIVYINFGAMLKSISRDDLTELYRIVMNRYGMDGPEDKLEKGFWKCLRTMFEEPLSTDPIWSELGQQKIISWRYYDTCRVHCLNLESMDVYMLSERKYPLSAEVCQTMLKMKLLDGKMNEDCYRMLKMMEKQAGIRK